MRISMQNSDSLKDQSFRTWVVDVKLTYVESDKPLIKRMFITNPVLEL